MESRYFKKAAQYDQMASLMADKENWSAPTMLLIEHAIECYVASILEAASGKSVYDIYPRGEVPHKSWRMFYDAKDYLREQGALKTLPYNRTLPKEIEWAFYTYDFFRFPKDEDKAYSTKEESDIRDAMDTLNILREYTKEFLNNYERFLENQKESDDMEI